MTWLVQQLAVAAEDDSLEPEGKNDELQSYVDVLLPALDLLSMQMQSEVSDSQCSWWI